MQLAFGDCLLDLDTRRLLRGGRPVHLQPKAYRLLEFLIQQRPRVVTKQELDELLWPKAYVARSSLGRLVAELRKAVGDRARVPRVVRTVHTVGYAFCADVSSRGSGGRRAPVITLRFAGRVFTLEDGEHVLGRGDGCRVVIDAAGVSRHHARIVVAGDSVLIDDLGSKNGTYVNRERISKPTQLRDADEVSLGTAVVSVRTMSAAGTTKTLLGP